jgi:hypothetical protein
MKNAPRFPVAQLPCLQAFLATLSRVVYCCIATAVSLGNITAAMVAWYSCSFVTSPLAGEGVSCIVQIRHTALFLRLFVPNNSMVQRRITFTLHIHSVLIHSRSGGRCFYVTGSSSVLFHFFVSEGVEPSTRYSSSFSVIQWKFRLLASKFPALWPSCSSRWLSFRFQTVAAPQSLGSWTGRCLPCASVISFRTSILSGFFVPHCP